MVDLQLILIKYTKQDVWLVSCPSSKSKFSLIELKAPIRKFCLRIQICVILTRCTKKCIGNLVSIGEGEEKYKLSVYQARNEVLKFSALAFLHQNIY
jgi:hypothetical protein